MSAVSHVWAYALFTAFGEKRAERLLAATALLKKGIHYQSHLLRLIRFQRIWTGLFTDTLMWLSAAIKVVPQ